MTARKRFKKKKMVKCFGERYKKSRKITQAENLQRRLQNNLKDTQTTFRKQERRISEIEEAIGLFEPAQTAIK